MLCTLLPRVRKSLFWFLMLNKNDCLLGFLWFVLFRPPFGRFAYLDIKITTSWLVWVVGEVE